jgi:hypothetical protein
MLPHKLFITAAVIIIIVIDLLWLVVMQMSLVLDVGGLYYYLKL